MATDGEIGPLHFFRQGEATKRQPRHFRPAHECQRPQATDTKITKTPVKIKVRLHALQRVLAAVERDRRTYAPHRTMTLAAMALAQNPIPHAAASPRYDKRAGSPSRRMEDDLSLDRAPAKESLTDCSTDRTRMESAGQAYPPSFNPGQIFSCRLPLGQPSPGI